MSWVSDNRFILVVLILWSSVLLFQNKILWHWVAVSTCSSWVPWCCVWKISDKLICWVSSADMVLFSLMIFLNVCVICIWLSLTTYITTVFSSHQKEEFPPHLGYKLDCGATEVVPRQLHCFNSHWGRREISNTILE